MTSIGSIKTTDFVLTAASRYSSATPCSLRNTTFEPTSKQFAFGYTFHPSLLRCVVYTLPLAKSCHKRNSKMFFSQVAHPFFLFRGILMPTIPLGWHEDLPKRFLSSKILLTSTTLILLNSRNHTYFSMASNSSSIDLALCSPSLSTMVEWTVLNDLHGSDHFSHFGPL